MKRFTLIQLICFCFCIALSGQTINYQFDTQNRLTQVAYPDGTTICYEYDLLGNRTQYLITGNGTKDLLVQNTVASTGSTDAGSSLSVSAEVRNLGTGSAGAHYLKVYLSEDNSYDGADLEVGSRFISSVAANAILVTNFNIQIPAETLEGNYYLIFFVDTDAQIDETDENNNTASIGIDITTLTPKPDLLVQNVALSSGYILSGDTLGLSFDYSNTGTADAALSTFRCYLSLNATFENTDIELPDASLDYAVLQGSFISGYNTIMFPSEIVPGNYFLLLVADADQVVNELDETNNLLAVPLSIVSEIGADYVLSHPKCGQNNGYIVLTIQSGIPPYSYAWSNGTTSNALYNLGEGVYSVIITDAQNAILEQSFTISAYGYAEQDNGNELKLYYCGGQTWEKFGSALALTDSLLLIGDPKGLGNNSYIGRAALYAYEADSWQQKCLLAPPTNAVNREFGYSVAVNRSRAAVAQTISGIGEVHLYDVSGVDCNFVQTVSASDGTNNNTFGSALILDGNRLFAGAQGSNKVYYFEFDGSSWNEIWSYSPPGINGNAKFGGALAFDYPTLYVGALNSSFNSTGGNIFVLDVSSGTPVLDTVLASPYDQQGQYFGKKISINSDYLAVAAERSHEDANYRGGVYIFDCNNNYTLVQKVFSPDPVGANNFFGKAVSINEFDYLVVSQAGGDQVFEYRHDGERFQLHQQFQMTDSNTGDYGTSLANNNEYTFVGAPDGNITGINYYEGVVYGYSNCTFHSDLPYPHLYYCEGDEIQFIPKIKNNNIFTLDRELLASDVDTFYYNYEGDTSFVFEYYNTDIGCTFSDTLIIDNDDTAVPYSYEYSGAVVNGVPVTEITACDHINTSLFGSNAQIHDDWAVVQSNDNIYIYHYENNFGWTHYQRLFSPDPQDNNFGTSIQLTENYLFVGSNNKVYVFQFNAIDWQFISLIEDNNLDGYLTTSNFQASDDWVIFSARDFNNNPNGKWYDELRIYQRTSNNEWQLFQEIEKGMATNVFSFAYRLDFDGKTLICNLGNRTVNGSTSTYTYYISIYTFNASTQQWEERIFPTAFNALHLQVDGDFIAYGDPYYDYNPVDNYAPEGRIYILKKFSNNAYGSIQTITGNHDDYLGLHRIILDHNHLYYSHISGYARRSWNGSVFAATTNYLNEGLIHDASNYLVISGADYDYSLTQLNKGKAFIRNLCPFDTELTYTPDTTICPGAYIELSMGNPEDSVVWQDQHNNILYLDSNYLAAQVISDSMIFATAYKGFACTLSDSVQIEVNYNEGLELLQDEIKILACDGVAADNFGASVDICGKWAIIGAPLDDDFEINAGAAYIYEKVNGNWIARQKLVRPDALSSDQFGYGVLITDSLAFVSAIYSDVNVSNGGAVFIYKLNNGKWELNQHIYPDENAAQDRFGIAMDYWNGYLVVSSTLNDNSSFGNNGAIYIFKQTDYGFEEVNSFYPTNGKVNNYFGNDLAIYNNIISIGNYNGNNNAEGGVHIYEFDGTNWNFAQALMASDAGSTDYFGHAVAIANDKVIVGAYGWDGTASNQGAVYTFEKIGGVWTEQNILTSPQPISSEYFGYDLDADGNSLVVGNPYNDIQAVNSGSVFCYLYTNDQWEESITLTASDGAVSDLSGKSVAIKDGIAISGVPDKDDLGTSSGAVYIYQLFNNHTDIDNDGIIDIMDNCPDDFNPSQEDIDGDNIGNICDPSLCENFDSGEIPFSWISEGTEQWLFTTNEVTPGWGASNVSDHTQAGGYFAWVDGSGTHSDDAFLMTQAIDISGLQAPTLKFWIFSNNAETPDDNATLYVNVSEDNGASWNNEFFYAGDHPEWIPVSVDLSSYMDSVRIQFHVDQTTMINEAWYNDILIDDVCIEEFDYCTDCIVIQCDTSIIQSYCYSNNDNTAFLYESGLSNTNLSIDFIVGEIEMSYDQITIYDGGTTLDPILFQGDNGGNLGGLNFTTSGPRLLVKINSDGSLSCADTSFCCSSPWQWSIGCSTQCPAEYDLTGMISDSVFFETYNHISSSQIIMAGSHVSYNAAFYIELHPNFEVQSSANFYAYIDGCGEALNRISNAPFLQAHFLPETNEVLCYFTLSAEPDNPVFRIFDVHGNKLVDIPAKTAKRGINDYRVKFGQGPGVYFLKLNTGKEILSCKFHIL